MNVSKQNKASKSSTKGTKGTKGRKASAAPVEAPEKPATKPAKVKGKKPAPAASKPGKSKVPVTLTPTASNRQRASILGKAVTAVIRLWGYHGATQVEILEALAKLGLSSVSPTTVGLQRCSGARGAEGPHSGGKVPGEGYTPEEKRALLSLVGKK